MNINNEIKLISFKEADKKKIVTVFNESFYDYVIKLQLSYDDFYTRMEIEGIDYQYSFVAIINGKYVGLIITTINTIDDAEYFRCGALGIIKAYRSKKVAQLLMDTQKKIFKKTKINNFILECVTFNNRALRFYEKENFKIQHELHYFYRHPTKTSQNIENGNFENLKQFIKDNNYYRDYQTNILLKKKLLKIKQIKINNKIIAMGASYEKKLVYLAVNPIYQNQGYGSKILLALNFKNELHVTTSNNPKLHNFLINNNFIKKDFSQYVLSFNPLKLKNLL